MKRLLVVGGTGFIGNSLVQAALNSNYSVTVLSYNPPKIQIANVSYIQADISKFKEVKSVIADLVFDYVVNISGYVDHSSIKSGGKEVIDVHFNGVVNLIHSLKRSSLIRFVQIGSSDEYGGVKAPQHENYREEPISPYSLAKVASTHLLQMLYRTEGFPSVIIRLFLVYGPAQNKQRFLPQIIQSCLKDEEFPTSTGEQLRDFCYIDDVVSGILNSLSTNGANGEVINLASGVPIRVCEVVNKVVASIGSGRAIFGEYNYRSKENMCLYADIEKAKKILSWQPLVDLDDGIERTIQYYKYIN